MRESSKLATFLVVSLLLLGVRPASAQEKGVGDVVVNGNVTVNGQRAISGSTVYGNQELGTGDQSTAIVSFRAKGGVLTVAPNSRVRVANTDGRIVVEVLSGSISLRPQMLPATVNTSKMRVDVDKTDTYRVTSSARGSSAEAGSKNAVTRDGLRDVTIRADEVNATWEGQAGKKEDKKRYLGIIIPALIGGPLAIGLALAVARGEEAPIVSPVLPK